MGESAARARVHAMRRHVSAALMGAVVLAFGFALASCGSDEDASDTTTTTETTRPSTTTTTPPPPPPPGPTEIRVRVVNGVPRGGIVRETVDQGDRVALVVTSDVADHVHVHGYDLFRDLVPGKRARMAFRARLTGRFVIELEDRHAQIAELTVNP
jgi:hypothetical protein